MNNGLDKKHAKTLTLRPPLGWNSYDCYGCSANQRVVRANLDAFAKKLKPAGYEYFVIDNGWFGEYTITPGEEFTREKHAADVRLDHHARLLPSIVSFPDGLKPLIDHAHSLGIKFGVHLMRGIPRKAVRFNQPILNTDVTAADIADVEDTCRWCDYMYGVNMDRPGAQAYYNSVIDQLADWGIDFIKYDDILHKPREIEAVADAIAQCDREIVLSLSPGDAMNPSDIDVYSRANMFRISGDIWDKPVAIERSFKRWEQVRDIAVDGLWPDLDMIPFGRLMVWNPATPEREGCFQLAGQGTARDDQFSPAQRRTFITQRALSASPLFMGGELTMSSDEVIGLVTHEQMLACNQNGLTGILAYRTEQVDVWLTPHRTIKDAGWFGLFNRTESPWQGEVDLRQIGINQHVQLWDIWRDCPVKCDSGVMTCELESDDVRFVRYGSFRQLKE
ncbi:MAG: glycoside hydrolase family 27 protein [Lentisphaeria bacterium]|nr:glycoside hydrolase family 27 protein [Lentisphaeria bacterium]